MPSWALVALLGCIRHGKVCIYTIDHKNGLNQPPEQGTLIAETDFFLQPEARAGSEEAKKQLAQETLEAYLYNYEQDQLPLLGDFKTFEKSMACTIDFLTKLETKKGRRFMIYQHSEDYPAKDVRLFTDLVYLEHKGYIELPDLLNITAIDQEVDELEVKLLIPAADIASSLVPAEPEAEYKGLKLFSDQGQLVYETKSVTVRPTTKSMQLLTRMMKQKGAWPLKDVIHALEIKTNVKDKEGRNAVDNILFTVNKHLDAVRFPYNLGITNSKVVWKDKDK
ncbi:hypothetical protein [Candidatus Avelusimicrobium caledoniensis]|uniref:hypothetical protein n=1 Tax=Candidatus Avelusimicrobium caledoniensis TaxID=3416220 RepID=UPI003D0AFF5E